MVQAPTWDSPQLDPPLSPLPLPMLFALPLFLHNNTNSVLQSNSVENLKTVNTIYSLFSPQISVGLITLVFLQYSRSLQQDSSTTVSGLRLGFMYIVPMDDVNTTRRTLASAAAIITFFVPNIACSTFSYINIGIFY